MESCSKKNIDQILVDQIDAAAMLSISVKTLQRRTADGTITCVRLGSRVLYNPQTLRGWAEKRELAKVPA